MLRNALQKFSFITQNQSIKQLLIKSHFNFHSSIILNHTHTEEEKEDSNTKKIDVTYIEKDGNSKSVKAKLGQNLLELAHKNEIDLEGACEGSLACSTCHLIIKDQKYYDMLPEAEDDENDMLDLAFGLTETSRLGCQIKATEELDGITVIVPSASRNIGKEVA